MRPIMERTLRDDLKCALVVLAGATVGYFLIGADDPSVLLGISVGCAVVIIALTILRRGVLNMHRRGKAHRDD